MKILKSHGMNDSCLNNVCHATLISRLLYASPAWWGFASIAEKQHLQAVLNRAVKWGFYDPKGLSVSGLATKRDDKLFKSILGNEEHTLPPTIQYTVHLQPSSKKSQQLNAFKKRQSDS